MFHDTIHLDQAENKIFLPNIFAIASGAVESTVKQIDRRLKISGAQWNQDNVPQALKH